MSHWHIIRFAGLERPVNRTYIPVPGRTNEQDMADFEAILQACMLYSLNKYLDKYWAKDPKLCSPTPA